MRSGAIGCVRSTCPASVSAGSPARRRTRASRRSCSSRPTPPAPVPRCPPRARPPAIREGGRSRGRRPQRGVLGRRSGARRRHVEDGDAVAQEIRPAQRPALREGPDEVGAARTFDDSRGHGSQERARRPSPRERPALPGGARRRPVRLEEERHVAGRDRRRRDDGGRARRGRGGGTGPRRLDGAQHEERAEKQGEDRDERERETARRPPGSALAGPSACRERGRLRRRSGSTSRGCPRACRPTCRRNSSLPIFFSSSGFVMNDTSTRTAGALTPMRTRKGACFTPRVVIPSRRLKSRLYDLGEARGRREVLVLREVPQDEVEVAYRRVLLGRSGVADAASRSRSRRAAPRRGRTRPARGSRPRCRARTAAREALQWIERKTSAFAAFAAAARSSRPTVASDVRVMTTRYPRRWRTS